MVLYTSLEYLVSVGPTLSMTPAHLVDFFGGVCPGLQGEGQSATMVDPAVVSSTTEPRGKEGGRLYYVVQW